MLHLFLLSLRLINQPEHFRMRKTIISLLALVLAAPLAGQAQRAGHKPKLVVNIVVSQLRYDWLGKFQDNLSEEGFRRFATTGMNYSSAYYNYMQTLSPVSLATLTTGVNPSMHGVVSTSWIDYVTGGRVSLIDDRAVQGLSCDPGSGCYSRQNIVMPTLGDKLLSESPASKVISIAANPISAIVMSGQTGTAYWMDYTRAVWITSTCFMNRLPDWVAKYNDTHPANYYVSSGWTPARQAKQYINKINTIFNGDKDARISSFRNGNLTDYNGLLRSPYGNTLVADFAKQVIVNEKLGADDDTDILNICFDASRYVGETYGSESMELEDMLYRLDLDLAALVKAVTAQVPVGEVLFVVTSDHGMSDSWDAGPVEQDRFNVNQFKTILNSFLGVQFGTGDWVVDYIDRQVYLNHNLIYKKNLSLEEVQNRAATFVLQFRGVSHVLTSIAMSNGYFGASYGHRMQNGFYPRRAGDLMLNFMPGWIEERPGVRSLPGSMYDYDTHVPLIMFGWKIPARNVAEPVDMTSVAPTLARIMQISRPTASDGVTLRDADMIVR